MIIINCNLAHPTAIYDNTTIKNQPPKSPWEAFFLSHDPITIYLLIGAVPDVQDRPHDSARKMSVNPYHNSLTAVHPRNILYRLSAVTVDRFKTENVFKKKMIAANAQLVTAVEIRGDPEEILRGLILDAY